MPDPAFPERQQPTPRTYRWPLFVAAALVLAILLAILWMSFEIRRTQRIRQLNATPDLPPRSQ